MEFPGNPSLLPPESGARYITDTWAHQPSSTQYMLASNGLYKIQLWSFSTILDYRPANISHNPDKSRPKVFAQFYDKGYLVFSDDQQLFKVPRSNFSNTEVLLLKDQWHDTDQCTIQNMDVDGKNQLAFVICSKSGSMLVVDLAHMQAFQPIPFCFLSFLSLLIILLALPLHQLGEAQALLLNHALHWSRGDPL